MIRRRIVLVETRRTAAASETFISGAMGVGAPSVPKTANLSGGGCDCVGSARSRSSAHDGIWLISTDAADPSTRSAPVRITGADPDCCLGLPLGVQAFKGGSASRAGCPRSRSIGVCGMPPLKDLFRRAAALFFGRHGPFPMPSGLPQTTASEDPRTDGVFQVVSDHGTRLPTMDPALALDTPSQSRCHQHLMEIVTIDLPFEAQAGHIRPRPQRPCRRNRKRRILAQARNGLWRHEGRAQRQGGRHDGSGLPPA